jgi:hypothetical protein
MVNPTNLDFGVWSTQMTFTIWNSGASNFDWSVSSTSSWLSVDPASGNTATETDTVTVTVDRTGQTAGDYGDILTVSAPAATNSPQAVSVMMTVVSTGFPNQAEGNISQSNKYAWSENAGWINFAPAHGGATVHAAGTNGCLSGYVWAENVGWIKLGNGSDGPYGNSTDTDWGVNMDAAGNLSGYAWGENVGWINFHADDDQVTIDILTGFFDGYAWAENVGWIHFRNLSPEYGVQTTVFAQAPPPSGLLIIR